MIEAVEPVDKARALFEEGLTIIPAREKIPLVNWQKYQGKEVSEDEFEYFASSARFTGCNWAIVTGKEVVVVDADSAEAEAWVKKHLPYTSRTVATARGRHFYYQANPDFPITNSTDPDSKIDVRGNGGIVIAAGSVHSSGAVYKETIDQGVPGDWRELPMLSATDLEKITHENQPKPLLNASQGGWHDEMIRYVGAQVQRGLSDDDILRTATGWTQAGYTHEQTFAEFAVAIKGARDKGWAETKEVATAEEIEQITDALAPMALDIGNIAALPKREWVYGRHYIRKFLSVTVAAGGTGKTALTLTEAMAMASGIPLLGIETPKRKVWVWNLEDPLDELKRRLAGIAVHHQIDADDYAGNLFVNSGRDSSVVIAENRGGEPIILPAADIILNYIKANSIDVIIVDPFVSSHKLNENDNGAMDLVVKTWGKIAEQGNCAVELVHHVRKAQNGQSASYGDARGASSLTDAARHVRRLMSMTYEEARNAGIDEADRWRFSREGDSKDNLAPPSRDSSWRQMISVQLDNGDNVGVPESWQWPDPFDEITLADLHAVQAEIRSDEWREDVRAKNWAGIAVANVLELDHLVAENKSKIKQLLSTWIQNRELKVVERADNSRHMRKYIEVGGAPIWTVPK
jgi:hypothetical protein